MADTEEVSSGENVNSGSSHPPGSNAVLSTNLTQPGLRQSDDSHVAAPPGGLKGRSSLTEKEQLAQPLVGSQQSPRLGRTDKTISRHSSLAEPNFDREADADVAELASQEGLVAGSGVREAEGGNEAPGGTPRRSIPRREHSAPVGIEEAMKRNAATLDALERCLAATVKGFVIGAGLKGGLALFGALGRLRRRAASRSSEKALATPAGKAAASAWRETLRYGLFLGTFAGGYCGADEAIAAVGGLKRTAKWRPLVAGAAAGPALLLTGRDTGHTSMALYILLRAAVLGARCGIKSARWGWLFRPLTWQHGDALLMCISSAQILYAWILEPHSLPSSYISFLNKHGGKDSRVIRAVKEVAGPQRPLPSLRDVKAAYREQGRQPSLDPNMKIPCGMLHPHQLCLTHFVSFLWRAYLRSIPVYLPVYVVPALLVHRRALLHRPLPILSKTAVGAARSSFFLAFYCASAWLWTCTLHQLAGRCNGTTLALGTFPAGLAVLFEKKSRRMELALYCLSRAIESFGICASEWGWFQSLRGIPKRLDVAMFSLATAIIMHCYNNERDVFRSKYLNVLDWVFGLPPLLANKQLPARPPPPRAHVGTTKLLEAARGRGPGR